MSAVAPNRYHPPFSISDYRQMAEIGILSSDAPLDQAPAAQRALAETLPDHPNLATAMDNYALILTKLGRDQEAAQWSAKAAAIHNKPINRKMIQPPTPTQPTLEK